MTDASEVFAAIVAADQIFMEAFKRGDAAGIASLYTETAQFLPPNSDAVAGRPAIQRAFQALMDMGIKTIGLETLEVEGYGDTASEVGLYTLAAADGQVLDRGKFLVIWKRQSGQWQLHRDMINTSKPAAS